MKANRKRRYLAMEKEIEFIRREKKLARVCLAEKKPASKQEYIKQRDLRALRRRRGSALSIIPPIIESPEMQDIIKWFILPWFTKEHLPTLSLKEKIELFFNVTTREVAMAVCVKGIDRMPGYIIDSDGTRRPPTTTEGWFPKGTPIFVRIDDNMPDRIDIEKADSPDLVFHLTKHQYKLILDSIKEISGCNYKLDPPEELTPTPRTR